MFNFHTCTRYLDICTICTALGDERTITYSQQPLELLNVFFSIKLCVNTSHLLYMTHKTPEWKTISLFQSLAIVLKESPMQRHCPSNSAYRHCCCFLSIYCCLSFLSCENYFSRHWVYCKIPLWSVLLKARLLCLVLISIQLT